MAERRPRHRYPMWLAWPIEVSALALIGLLIWNYLQVSLQIAFQQWPQAFESLSIVPYVPRVALILAGHIPAGPPLPWEGLYPVLLQLNIRTFAYVTLVLLLRNFLPQLRSSDKGLQVRRGWGWATIPWSQITFVHSMALAGDKLVLLIQGRRLRLGPWFRFYSLLWGAGLAKGVVVSWHISQFDTLADDIIANLDTIHGDDLALVVDDSAYSFLYALFFQPRTTWRSLFAPRRTLQDAYAHPKWVPVLMRFAAGLLVIVSLWRYLGVWWRFLAGRFSNLMNALHWPIVGPLLSAYGQPPQLSPSDPELMRQAAMGLLAAQVSIMLTLIIAIFLLNLFPNWLLGAEGLSVYFRRGWLQIPWQAIRSLRETLFRRGGGVILLQTDETTLSRWHGLFSLFYGAGLRRGVLFTSVLPGFEDMRQRIHVGIVRAYEGNAEAPAQPILEEHGQADFLSMLREPLETLRRLKDQPEEGKAEEGGRLFRDALTSSSSQAGSLPWEMRQSWEEGPFDEEDQEEAGLDQKRALRAALGLATFPLILVLMEELLFPPLSRPLALLSIGPLSLGSGIVPALLLAVLMGLCTLLEWFFVAILLSTISEMLSQSGEFQRARTLYPRIQSPRIIVGFALILLGATGTIQPLFLFWWFITGLWGALLLWLAGRTIYNWRGLGNVLLLAGYSLFQGVVLLAYYVFH